ncbi:CCPGW family putative bacteriocin [Chryseobacterium kwangjuense]|uniref:CCPGW family putative bacteriocin n=1 Tax=Chryseobacterium kwangjuense TaxID=267125 RepID=A0ABW9K0T2_9FLAO
MITMKNLKKLSRGEMKNLQGADSRCNPQIICQRTSDCCPGWVCATRGRYCVAL